MDKHRGRRGSAPRSTTGAAQQKKPPADTILASLESLYNLQSKKGEGTFSEVIKGERKSDSQLCAIKRMKGTFQSVDKVDSLREVQALRRLNGHDNIIQLLDVIYDPEKKTLDMSFELMEMNIYERIKGRRHHLPEELVKSYMYQLLKALDHMHRNGIFHRDVKPENVLISGDKLKLADLGSCRGVYSKPPFTEYISTRWYRAPECLLTNGYYGYKMDVWSVGCVMFEVMSLYPLFPGANELDQINKIHDVMGTPPPHVLTKIRKNSQHMNMKFPDKRGKGLAKLLPTGSADCLAVLEGLLEYDPDARLSAKHAMKHNYFRDLRDADKRAAKGTEADNEVAEEKDRSRPRDPEDQSLNRTLTDKLTGKTPSHKPSRHPKREERGRQRNIIGQITNRFISHRRTVNAAPGGMTVINGPQNKHPMHNPRSTKRRGLRKAATMTSGATLPPLAVSGSRKDKSLSSTTPAGGLPKL
eukprot:TRINITY_DN8701_c0_g1_i2.p1 TRINITY_DN8701_c0_g1~~TRINITY_DN8701_c0_g1_i2.p1  ORF type:complete len:514 (+),score=57.70 TRINITY_DN8701_c0_g1_i2:128-1543(+)